MPENTEETESILSFQAKRKLHKISRWGKFISLSSCILVILLIILITRGILSRTLPVYKDSLLSSTERNPLLIIYLALLLLTLFPCIKLYLFSHQCSKAIKANDKFLLAKSFDNLLSFFRFLGIILLILLLLYLLFIFMGTLATLFNWGRY
ncbi:hypothetical protein [Flavihumibacter sp. ZG627]|uniref:hypothetical protein n=1 Tax=Flavihumibacter sp. ZG627 TaxID=1463156 RepID=UPI00057F9625|nr:hypothetical protein [Flavihumibacter sp. ZG627]KIC91485.1 hypothetical protein HY58_04370 [Flavihumibacter sp. ZG627]